MLAIISYLNLFLFNVKLHNLRQVGWLPLVYSNFKLIPDILSWSGILNISPYTLKCCIGAIFMLESEHPSKCKIIERLKQIYLEKYLQAFIIPLILSNLPRNVDEKVPNKSQQTPYFNLLIEFLIRWEVLGLRQIYHFYNSLIWSQTFFHMLDSFPHAF